jgi:hypothetical protein
MTGFFYVLPMIPVLKYQVNGCAIMQKSLKRSVMKPFDGQAATVGNGSVVAVYCMTV